MLLLGDFQAPEALGVPAANLLAMPGGNLPHILGNIFGLGDLAAVTEERLNLQLERVCDVHIGVGMSGTTEIHLSHLVRGQSLVRLWDVGRGASRWVDSVKHG